jgi:hypothetical protein
VYILQKQNKNNKRLKIYKIKIKIIIKKKQKQKEKEKYSNSKFDRKRNKHNPHLEEYLCKSESLLKALLHFHHGIKELFQMECR